MPSVSIDETQIRDARPGDVVQLLEVIRASDLDEIRCRHEMPPVVALTLLVAAHPPGSVYAITWNGHTHALFGIQPIGAHKGMPWFLSSDQLIIQHKRRFVRESKVWLGKISSGYASLENFTLATNEVHIRWLKSLGFVFDESHVTFPASDRKFVRFSMILNAALMR